MCRMHTGYIYKEINQTTNCSKKKGLLFQLLVFYSHIFWAKNQKYSCQLEQLLWMIHARSKIWAMFVACIFKSENSKSLPFSEDPPSSSWRDLHDQPLVQQPWTVHHPQTLLLPYWYHNITRSLKAGKLLLLLQLVSINKRDTSVTTYLHLVDEVSSLDSWTS